MEIIEQPTLTMQLLKERQSWTLNQKIDHSFGVIEHFCNELNDEVYCSFSGGKDSTVLLDLCRILRPNMKAVFCNTGNEYPDIVKFVRSTANCEIIYPKQKPYEVIERYGFPLISKDISSKIHAYQTNPKCTDALRATGELITKFSGKVPDKYQRLMREGKIRISGACCLKMKKEPFKHYEKISGLSPVVGIMADESRMRSTMYIKQGQCNSFSERRPISMPLAIWTESDIWQYIETRKLKIADIYYKGAKRTGCMFCGFGCQFKDDNRLQMLLDLYPKMYHKCMSYTNNNITYREAMREVLRINELYLPDEQPNHLFSEIE